MKATHEVTNQVPPLLNYNLYDSDAALKKAITVHRADWAHSKLKDFGALLGTAEMIHAGFLANANLPLLHTHDRFGHRIDQVEFHPAYHTLFSASVSAGLHSSPWKEPRLGAHVARAAGLYLAYQNEQGHICPVTMTYGAVPTLRRQPDVTRLLEEKILTNDYDPRFVPLVEKRGALIGMAMTEKQGGSDLRTNATQAVPIGRGGPGEEYLLTGHKWFCSAPMCDAFLILAQTNKGPSCFLVPRWTPDQKRNPFLIQRLKNKLGDRANASSEIELNETWAVLIGEEGRGIPTIIEMANYTRLDCAVAAAAAMRQSLVQALHHASHRMAFGKTLVQQPLMANVLADLCLESEAATVLVFRLAEAYDHQNDEIEIGFRRIATAMAKFWLTRQSIYHVSEALEVHGGNGYVEDSILPRLYRQVPVNSIWEGSGNVMCLDILRVIAKEPHTLEIFFNEVQKGAVKNISLKNHLDQLKNRCHSMMLAEHDGRWLLEQMALALQASLLLQHSDPHMAELFCNSRLEQKKSFGFGALPDSAIFKHVITRAF